MLAPACPTDTCPLCERAAWEDPGDPLGGGDYSPLKDLLLPILAAKGVVESDGRDSWVISRRWLAAVPLQDRPKAIADMFRP